MKIHGMVPWDGEQDEIWAKDWDLSRFLRKFPHMADVVSSMRGHLPEREHVLVDMIVKVHVPGDSTCKDVRWHFDGDYGGTNAYALWARGPNRTEFPETIPELDPPSDRESQNRYLEGLGLRGVEVPEMHVATYDSTVPHRGVVCGVPGKRIFLRVVSTDTIKPKNFVRRES